MNVKKIMTRVSMIRFMPLPLSPDHRQQEKEEGIHHFTHKHAQTGAGSVLPSNQNKLHHG